MSDGTEFDVTCYTIGDDVLGDSVWDYGTDASTGATGYAADYYIDTPVSQGQEARPAQRPGPAELRFFPARTAAGLH